MCEWGLEVCIAYRVGHGKDVTPVIVVAPAHKSLKTPTLAPHIRPLKVADMPRHVRFAMGPIPIVNPEKIRSISLVKNDQLREEALMSTLRSLPPHRLREKDDEVSFVG